MYIFKYHPDNTIYRNDSYIGTYAEFIEQYPNFPIIEKEFFEYRDDGFDLINAEGHHIPRDVADFQVIINAIGELDV